MINDQIHCARHVRKVASLAMAAFASPGHGPAGEVVEGQPIYLHSASPRRTLPVPSRTHQRVALLEACLDGDTALLQALPDLDYEGVVIAGFGAGHVSLDWATHMAAIARSMPVIVATRTGSDATARSTYGFAGGEIDLLSKGMRMAGALCPRKCRILLWLLLGTAQTAELDTWLAR